jgi:hypothetical protein
LHLKRELKKKKKKEEERNKGKGSAFLFPKEVIWAVSFSFLVRLKYKVKKEKRKFWGLIKNHIQMIRTSPFSFSIQPHLHSISSKKKSKIKKKTLTNFILYS